jgi:hypothetical protein
MYDDNRADDNATGDRLDAPDLADELHWIEEENFGTEAEPIRLEIQVEQFSGGDALITFYHGEQPGEIEGAPWPFHAVYSSVGAAEPAEDFVNLFRSRVDGYTPGEIGDLIDEYRNGYNHVVSVGAGSWIHGTNINTAAKATRS